MCGVKCGGECGERYHGIEGGRQGDSGVASRMPEVPQMPKREEQQHLRRVSAAFRQRGHALRPEVALLASGGWEAHLPLLLHFSLQPVHRP